MSDTCPPPQPPRPSIIARILGYLPQGRRLLSHLPFRSRTTEKSKPPSYDALFPTRGTLTDMPADILILITQQLPPSSRLVLAHACRTLHAALAPQLPACRRLLCGPADYCAYLACIARDLPDSWVCEGCVALHKVPSDKALAGGPGCLIPPCSKKGWEGWVGYVRILTLSNIYHCHIQLALKYTRLGVSRTKKQQRRLDLLLASFSNKLVPGSTTAPNAPVAYWKSVIPKIINGLYFLRIVVRYDVTGMEPNLSEDYGMVIICPHEDWSNFEAEMARGIRNRPRNPPHSIVEVVRSAMTSQRGTTGPREAHGFCKYCDTDYSVQLCPEAGRDYLVIKIWHNFGADDSPLSAPWVNFVGCHGSRWDTTPPSFRSKQQRISFPGSCRETYEIGS